MITFFQLLQTIGIPHSKIRMIRHGDGEIPILETFQNDRSRFDIYQGFQRSGAFSGSERIASFAPLPKNEALFLGIWKINNCRNFSELKPEHKKSFDTFKFISPVSISNLVFYELEFESVSEEFSERVVIDWGKSAIIWNQLKDKKILEIKRPKAINDFYSYSNVELDFHQLQKIINNPNSNATWIKALSAVNAVYLIRDKSTGLLYIGSAYGKYGLLQRWQDYSLNGNAGNQALKSLNPDNFVFSILEIAHPALSANEVINLENKWKNRLGTRQNGHLNLN